MIKHANMYVDESLCFCDVVCEMNVCRWFASTAAVDGSGSVLAAFPPCVPSFLKLLPKKRKNDNNNCFLSCVRILLMALGCVGVYVLIIVSLPY